MARCDERIERVPTASLAADAEGFSFSWPPPQARAALDASVARQGIFRPLLGVATPRGVRVVDGLRRLEAARAAGVDSLWVRLLGAESPVALWDRLLEEREGVFNVVERGLYLAKRIAATGETPDDLSRSVLPALGVPPRAAAAAEPLWIASLPPRHRDRFAAGELPAQGLRPLLAAPPEDVLAVLDLTDGFRLGVNKFPETARLFFECAWREGLGVREWAEKTEVLQKCREADDLRERLWAARNPMLAAWTRDFGDAAKTCPLPAGAQVAHAKGFEGGRLRLTLSFSSLGELAQQAKALADGVERGDYAPLSKFLG